MRVTFVFLLVYSNIMIQPVLQCLVKILYLTIQSCRPFLGDNLVSH